MLIIYIPQIYTACYDSCTIAWGERGERGGSVAAGVHTTEQGTLLEEGDMQPHHDMTHLAKMREQRKV